MPGNIIFIHYCLLLLKKMGFIAEYYLFKTQFLIFVVMYQLIIHNR